MKGFISLVVGLIVLVGCNSQQSKKEIVYNPQAMVKDTMSHQPGKPGGFIRIREVGEKDTIIYKCWFIDWDSNNGNRKINYSESDSLNRELFSIDSVYYKNGKIKELSRRIDNIEKEEYEFNSNGKLISKSIWINDMGSYTGYIRELRNGEWEFRSIVDGYPPTHLSSSPEEFLYAENKYFSSLAKQNLEQFQFDFEVFK